MRIRIAFYLIRRSPGLTDPPFGTETIEHLGRLVVL